MPSSFDVSYTYDAVGNRISQTSSAGTIIYTYDAANQLTLETHPGHLVTYTYDADGNPTEKVDDGLSTAYEWDENNRLISAEPPAASDPTTITYNADGQRVAKETGAETTKFIYDFKKLLAETDGADNVDLEYTYTNEEYGDTLSETNSSDTLYHQYDAPGSTSALINDSDSAINEYAYRAFGLATDEPAGDPTNLMFIGQQQYYRDLEIELYLLGAGNSDGGGRYYDPATGRFLSQDPAGPDTDPLKNLYRYVANNPLNAIDPSGQDTVGELNGVVIWESVDHTRLVNGLYPRETRIIGRPAPDERYVIIENVSPRVNGQGVDLNLLQGAATSRHLYDDLAQNDMALLEAILVGRMRATSELARERARREGTPSVPTSPTPSAAVGGILTQRQIFVLAAEHGVTLGNAPQLWLFEPESTYSVDEITELSRAGVMRSPAIDTTEKIMANRWLITARDSNGNYVQPSWRTGYSTMSSVTTERTYPMYVLDIPSSEGTYKLLYAMRGVIDRTQLNSPNGNDNFDLAGISFQTNASDSSLIQQLTGPENVRVANARIASLEVLGAFVPGFTALDNLIFNPEGDLTTGLVALTADALLLAGGIANAFKASGAAMRIATASYIFENGIGFAKSAQSFYLLLTGDEFGARQAGAEAIMRLIGARLIRPKPYADAAIITSEAIDDVIARPRLGRTHLEPEITLDPLPPRAAEDVVEGAVVRSETEAALEHLDDFGYGKVLDVDGAPAMGVRPAAHPSGSGPATSIDFGELPDNVLFRIRRGDARGRPFGTPRNPDIPTLEEFNPRIHEVRAGDLGDVIVERVHGLFSEQQEAIARLPNEELLRFRLDDPISATGQAGRLSLTGGHHRTAEIARRVASGELPSDTIVRILLHD